MITKKYYYAAIYQVYISKQRDTCFAFSADTRRSHAHVGVVYYGVHSASLSLTLLLVRPNGAILHLFLRLIIRMWSCKFLIHM